MTMLSLREMAADLGVTSEYVRKKCISCELPALKTGKGRTCHWKVREKDWAAFKKRLEWANQIPVENPFD